MTSREILKKHGIKYSKHRAFILGILKEHELPLSADQIFVLCTDEDSNMSLSTVYRILHAFVEKGIALKTTLEFEDRMLFELQRHEHKHRLLCKGCNQIVQISSCPLKAYEKSLQKELGYLITSHKLEIYGYCPACKADMEKSEKETVEA